MMRKLFLLLKLCIFLLYNKSVFKMRLPSFLKHLERHVMPSDAVAPDSGATCIETWH